MNDARVFVVDDEDDLAQALGFLFESRGVATERFASGEAFVAALGRRPGWDRIPGAVLLDVRLGGMSGLEVFSWLRTRAPHLPLPVLFLSGHGDIGMAVDALKDGAFDFVEKPCSDNRLVDRVLAAIETSRQRIARAATEEAVRARLGRLSQREREVMDRILEGRLNKLIADDLGISMRTVEVHRASIFAKMEVRSAVELARLLEAARIPAAPR